MTAPAPGVGAVVGAGLAPVIENTRPSLALSDVLYAAISANVDGNNTLVAAVAGKRIRVLSLALVASGGVNTAQLQTAAGGIALTGVMDLASDGQVILPYNDAGWCECGTGELLNLALTEANVVAGMLTYVLAG
jgi:hypothetical protein